MKYEPQQFSITDRYLTVGMRADHAGVVRFETLKLDLRDPEVQEVLDKAIQMVFTIRARLEPAWDEDSTIPLF